MSPSATVRTTAEAEPDGVLRRQASERATGSARIARAVQRRPTETTSAASGLSGDIAVDLQKELVEPRILKNGKAQTIYFFAKEKQAGALDELPEGREVAEAASGLPLLKRKQ